MPAGQQELAGRGMRELGRRTEPAVADVERSGHLVRAVRDERGAHGTRLRFVQRFCDVLADAAGVGGDLLAVLAVGARDLEQHGAEPRTAVVIVLGRKVGAAEEHLAVRCQERREGPTALAGERLDGALVTGVDVGTLVAVHFDADELAVQDLRDPLVFVRFSVHHVAPVAPHRADVEQDRLVLGARPLERRLAPGEPVDRLMGSGLEVGGGLGREEVGHLEEM